MPKAFIYSARNYRNPKATYDDEGTHSGPNFPSRIFTRSVKLTDPQGNEVPWHIVEHYHHHHHHHHHHYQNGGHHQSVAKARGVTAGNGGGGNGNSNSNHNSSKGGSRGGSARERERKRKLAKAKPKSFHHLSLVTRFQLGLRMSRLQSKQQQSCLGNGSCRMKGIGTSSGGDETNSRLWDKVKGVDSFCGAQSCETGGRDEDVQPSALLGQSENSSSELLSLKHPINEEWTPELSTEARGKSRLNADDLLQDTQGEMIATDNDSTSKVKILNEHNMFQNSLNARNNQSTGTCDSDIKNVRVCCSTENCPSKSMYGMPLSAGSEIKPMFFSDQSSSISNGDDPERGDSQTGEAGLSSSPTRFKYTNIPRPKIVITLPGTKPYNSDRQHIVQEPNVSTFPTSGSTNIFTPSPERIGDNFSIVLNSTNPSTSQKPCQLIYTPIKALRANSNGMIDNPATPTLTQISKRLSAEDITCSQSKLGNNFESCQTGSLANVSNTTETTTTTTADTQQDEMSKENFTNLNLPKSNIVFIVKPNLNDETERKRLPLTDVPFQNRTHQTHTKTSNTFMNNEQSQTHVEEKPEIEDLKQRKIIIAYNKMLWKPNFVNKENDEKNGHNIPTPFEMSSTSRIKNDAKNLNSNTPQNYERNGEWCQDNHLPTHLKSLNSFNKNDYFNAFTKEDLIDSADCAFKSQTLQYQNLSNKKTCDAESQQYPNTEEFQRLKAPYCNSQEQSGKTIDPSNYSDIQHITRENRAPGSLYDIFKSSTQRDHYDTLGSSGLRKERSPLNITVFQHGNTQTQTETISSSYNLNTKPGMSSSDGLNNSNRLNRSEWNYDGGDCKAREKSLHPINTSQILFVPSSNVFTVTPSDLHYDLGSQCNKVTLRDNSTVTWSNPLLDNNYLMSHNNHTSIQISNHARVENGRNALPNTIFPPGEISNGVVNLPCDYKIPIRKDSSAAEFMPYNPCASKTNNAMHYLNIFSRGYSSHQYIKTPLQYVENETLQNVKPSSSTHSVDNANNKRKIPTMDNFIGWVPVRFADLNEKAQKPSLYIPAHNLSSKQHDVVTVDLEMAMKTNKTSHSMQQNIAIPHGMTQHAATNQGNEALPSAIPHFGNMANFQNGSPFSIRTIEKTIPTNDAPLPRCIPDQLSWFQMPMKSENTVGNTSQKGLSELWMNHQLEMTMNSAAQKSEALVSATLQPQTINFTTTQKTETIDFPTNKQKTMSHTTQTPETIAFVSPKQERLPFATEKPESMQFAIQKPDKITFATQQPETVSFATPAADLLSSVARAPAILPGMKNPLHHVHHDAILFKNSSTSSRFVRTSDYPSKVESRHFDEINSKNMVSLSGNQLKRDTDVINTSWYSQFGQTFLSTSRIGGENDQPRTAKRHRFESGIENIKDEYDNLRNPTHQNWTDLINQTGKESMPTEKPVNVTNVYNPPLVLLRENNSGTEADTKAVFGILRPVSTHNSEAHESGLKRGRESFSPTITGIHNNGNNNSNSNNTALLQSTIVSKSCESLTPSMYTEWKTNGPLCDSSNGKTVKSSNAIMDDRSSQLYIAGQFVGGGGRRGGGGCEGSGGGGGDRGGQQQYLSSIYSISAHPTTHQQGIIGDIGRNEDDNGLTLEKSRKSDEVPAPMFQWENTIGGQPYYIKSETVEKLSTEDAKSSAWRNSLFDQTDSSCYSGPDGIHQFSRQDLLNRSATTTTTTTSSSLYNNRCDFSCNKGQGRDFPPQISTMSFCSASSATSKPYENIGGNGSLSNHNNNNINNNNNNNSNNVCPICHRRFTRPWLLKGHMRTHTGERPFQCSFPSCDKAFADKSNLRSHMQTHTAVTKKFECSRCGRAFSQKRYLHKHTMEVCKYGNK